MKKEVDHSQKGKRNRWVFTTVKRFILLTFFCLSYIMGDCQGGNFEWVKQLNVGLASSAVDPAGNVYLTGQFSNTVDFDPDNGVFELTAINGLSNFTCKFNTAGALEWANQTNGPFSQRIAVDGSGNVYKASSESGTFDFDPGVDTFLVSSSSNSVFIQKLDDNGEFVWAKVMGEGDFVVLRDFQADYAGNTYFTGRFSGTVDFDPGAGEFFMTSVDDIFSDDVFVAKLDADGNFVWAKQFGGEGDETGRFIHADKDGNVYILGGFEASVDFDPGDSTFVLTPSHDIEYFIAKLDVNGSFKWALQMEAQHADMIRRRMVTDEANNLYLYGMFFDIYDFNLGPEFSPLITDDYSTDVFILKLNEDGQFVWAKKLGGSFEDVGTSISVDAENNLLLTGYFNGTLDCDPGPETFELTGFSGFDIFVAKLDSSGQFGWAIKMVGANLDYGEFIHADTNGNVYTSGTFNATMDFDPGPMEHNLNAINGHFFFHKMSDMIVGTPGVNRENNTFVYPNPAKDHVIIQTDESVLNGSIQLFAIDGKPVSGVKELTQNNYKLDLTGFSNGLYFLVLKKGKSISVVKIAKVE